MKTAIVVHKISLSNKELRLLSEPEKSVIHSINIAHNDIRFFEFITLSTAHIHSQDDVTREYQAVRYTNSLRHYSSAIIRFIEYIQKNSEIMSRIMEGNELYFKLNRKLRKLRKDRFYNISKEMRDKFTAHFDSNMNTAHINSFDHDDIHHIYLHDIVGNSISAFSEEIGFLGRLKSRQEVLAYENWNRTVGSLLQDIYMVLMIHVMRTIYPGKKAEQILLEVESDLVVDVDKLKLPVFLTPVEIGSKSSIEERLRTNDNALAGELTKPD